MNKPSQLPCSTIISLFTVVIIIISSASSAVREEGFTDPKGPIEWWQTGVIYQVYPRSFKDSDGDGIGDLRGIEEKAEYFKDLGITAVWLSPIYKSPMADFGYDISDFKNIAPEYGTLDDFSSLKSKLHSLGLKLILDFVPNHTSDEHEWFQKSIKKIDPYTDYYVWRDPKGWKDGKPILPNNWISNFTGPAWTYNEERKQFYLHCFGVKQPDLNYRNKRVTDEIVSILQFWMDEGVDGFRIDAVPFLVEHNDYQDEPLNEGYDKKTGKKDILEYNSLNHIYTLDQPEAYDIVKLFKKTITDHNNDFKSRVMVTEAYTSLNKTLQYYGGSEGAGINMPFNFLFIMQLDAKSSAEQFSNTIHSWMDNMPAGKWPNWVSSNHDNPRTATRYGDALADGINMLILLLPGTAFTYYGEEIGMQDTEIRWDETVDPQGLNAGPDHYEKFTRDPCRTPFQWDRTISAGFSKSHKTWLPVNPNYWYLSLENQKRTLKSHYHVYKRLVHLRNTNPTIQRGWFITRALFNHTLLLIRKMDGYPTFAVIVNLGSEEVVIDLENIHELPSEMFIHTSSINSEHDIGDVLAVFRMRPKSSLVLTTGNVDDISTPEKKFAPLNPSAGATLSIKFWLFFSIVLISCLKKVNHI